MIFFLAVNFLFNKSTLLFYCKHYFSNWTRKLITYPTNFLAKREWWQFGLFYESPKKPVRESQSEENYALFCGSTCPPTLHMPCMCFTCPNILKLNSKEEHTSFDIRRIISACLGERWSPPKQKPVWGAPTLPQTHPYKHFGRKSNLISKESRIL